MDASQLGASLREWREKHGYAQAALADAMRDAGHGTWSQATVWSAETGNRNLLYAEGITLSMLLPGFGINADQVGRDLIRDAQTLRKIRRLIETESSV